MPVLAICCLLLLLLGAPQAKVTGTTKRCSQSGCRGSCRTGAKDPRDLFAAAVLRARPFAEVKSVRIGGSSYRVPVEIPEKRQRSLVLRWMVLHARKR